MTIYEHILQWANDKNLRFQQSEQDIVFFSNGQIGDWISRVRAIEEDGMIFVLSAYPFYVDPEDREAAALALCEINCTLKTGTFYLDPEDGQINFRLGQFLWPTNDEETAQRVDYLIMLAMGAMDAYYQTMLDIADEE